MVLALDQVWVGLAEIGLGLIFCFIGYSAARVVLALWGALVGFLGGILLHALLIQWVPGGMFNIVPWWATAIVAALLTAWLSFAFYTIGVLLSMGAVGWGLGQVVSSALHLPGWIAFATGLVVAAGLVMVGWTLNLPRVLLIVLTALVGAGGVIDGVQLLLGARLEWLSQAAWQFDLTRHALWGVGYLVVAGLGMYVQFRQSSDDTLRDAYLRA
ncbi:MAG: DUF4203 domain-containing protein [Propionibacteriaceae bacterium]|nr:DUF4203 domain-containing protein [Propionibacteriaceae bacterium]